MNIIRIVKKGKADVTIQLDNDKNLILAVEVFLKSGLKKGTEISDDRFLYLVEQNKIFHIKQRAFRLLGRRQHSSSELKRKLWNKDYDRKLIEEVITELESKAYIDDEEFIKAFILEKSQTRNWSVNRLKSELIKRGISQKQIDLALSEQPKQFEKESALKLANKKYQQLLNRNLETKELRNKISTFLFSKGFNYELIKEVCDSIINIDSEEF